MAEREGFEPSIGLTLYALSRGAPSATRPPLRARRNHNTSWAVCRNPKSSFKRLHSRNTSQSDHARSPVLRVFFESARRWKELMKALVRIRYC